MSATLSKQGKLYLFSWQMLYPILLMGEKWLDPNLSEWEPRSIEVSEWLLDELDYPREYEGIEGDQFTEVYYEAERLGDATAGYLDSSLCACVSEMGIAPSMNVVVNHVLYALLVEDIIEQVDKLMHSLELRETTYYERYHNAMPVFFELKHTAAKSALFLKVSVSTTIRSHLARISEELSDEWLMRVQSVIE